MDALWEHNIDDVSGLDSCTIDPSEVADVSTLSPDVAGVSVADGRSCEVNLKVTRRAGAWNVVQHVVTTSSEGARPPT